MFAEPPFFLVLSLIEPWVNVSDTVDAIVREFKDRFGGEPRVFSAPGRVNLIGEHTDYNEGFVLPFAIQMRTFAACLAREDRRVCVYTRTLDKSAEFSLDDSPKGQANEWSLYIRGMAAALEDKGRQLRGANVVIDSEIPFGAGLSSSAALEVCSGLAFSVISECGHGLREIAYAGQEVEHQYIGVRSGLMDQLTSALGRRDNALLIDCRSNSVDYIPLELKGLSLVICDTKVKHDLAASAYNDRRNECEQGLELLSEHLGEIQSLRDVSADDLENYKSVLPDPVRKRCRHVVTENARVLAAVDAIKHADFAEVGRLMYLSHHSLRDDYEVSSPELDLLVDTASRLDCVLGARMTGGGFGGCTINLIEGGLYFDFEHEIRASYVRAFGSEPVVFQVRPSDGARQE